MKINKYLKELGLEQEDMPGYYDEKLLESEETEDKAGADIRNKEDEEGFSEREFFNLDYTMALWIYSRLCYFKEYISPLATPGCLSCLSGFGESGKTEEERKILGKAKADKWQEILDKMIEAFKLKIVGSEEGYEGIDAAKIREGMQAFIDYYDCLWY